MFRRVERDINKRPHCGTVDVDFIDFLGHGEEGIATGLLVFNCGQNLGFLLFPNKEVQLNSRFSRKLLKM